MSTQSHYKEQFEKWLATNRLDRAKLKNLFIQNKQQWSAILTSEPAVQEYFFAQLMPEHDSNIDESERKYTPFTAEWYNLPNQWLNKPFTPQWYSFPEIRFFWMMLQLLAYVSMLISLVLTAVPYGIADISRHL